MFVYIYMYIYIDVYIYRNIMVYIYIYVCVHIRQLFVSRGALPLSPGCTQCRLSRRARIWRPAKPSHGLARLAILKIRPTAMHIC